MNKKNTILLAILINAGLLAVLFVTAMTSQEEISIAPTHEISTAATLSSPQPPAPLFGDELDLASNVMHNEIPNLVSEEPKIQEEKAIVHLVPPVAQNEVPVPSPELIKEEKFAQVVVKKGDTMEKIAKEHRTTVDEILTLNQLPSTFLRIGQTLKIPAEKSAPAKAAAPKSILTEKTETKGPEYYTVKVGDNPWTISMKHHLKVEELLKLNGLNEERARKLKPGDKLRIK